MSQASAIAPEYQPVEPRPVDLTDWCAGSDADGHPESETFRVELIGETAASWVVLWGDPTPLFFPKDERRYTLTEARPPWTDRVIPSWSEKE